jgi:2-C-methyl-D-erythritol 4-phosphate cytidylyltransferase/2-C-methyl-D-erythritol 2,4-cyclodiphosphate synthase
VVLVAAGSGTRFGSRKQFVELLPGVSILDRSYEVARSVSSNVIVVVPPDTVRSISARYPLATVIAGGSTRTESVRFAIPALKELGCSFVLVHDAARPLASHGLYLRILESLKEGAVAVVPGLPVYDTVKRVRSNEVLETLDREELRRIQTPQGFKLESFLQAYGQVIDVSDDAALFERCGIKVQVIQGEEQNIKVTAPGDLDYVRVALTPGSLSILKGKERCVNTRVGSGFDIHRFSKDPLRKLMVGGVQLEGPGLEGHSDADVLCHAISDAILGASGLGDIGEHFSEKDPRWEGADSVEILRACVSLAKAKGYVVEHVDATVVCETPRITPYKGVMTEVLSSALGAPVNIKAKTAEKLGSIGRSEGVAAFCTVLMRGDIP